MTEHQTHVDARPPEPGTSEAPNPDPPFVVEDRTDPEVRALLEEVVFLRRWVQAERAAGHAPN